MLFRTLRRAWTLARACRCMLATLWVTRRVQEVLWPTVACCTRWLSARSQTTWPRPTTQVRFSLFLLYVRPQLTQYINHTDNIMSDVGLLKIAVVDTVCTSGSSNCSMYECDTPNVQLCAPGTKCQPATGKDIGVKCIALSRKIRID